MSDDRNYSVEKMKSITPKKKADNTVKKQLKQQNKYSRLKQREFSIQSEGLVLATIRAILPL